MSNYFALEEDLCSYVLNNYSIIPKAIISFLFRKVFSCGKLFIFLQFFFYPNIKKFSFDQKYKPKEICLILLPQ